MTDSGKAANPRIAETWAECGVRSVKPARQTIMVRTELLPEYIGRIFIPPHLRGNYTDLPHKVFMWGLVLSTGSECQHIKVGDRVGFSRLFFARWQYMEDKTLVGWVKEENVYLLAEEDGKVEQINASASATSGLGASVG